MRMASFFAVTYASWSALTRSISALSPARIADSSEITLFLKASTRRVIAGVAAVCMLFVGSLPDIVMVSGEPEAKVRALVDRIERGIFWPPSPKDAWRWDFADWIFNTPEESVDAAWLAAQKKLVDEA